MKKIICIILCLAMMCANTVFAEGQNYEKYSSSIRKMESFGIMKGSPDGALEPEREITRSEFATVLIRIMSLESVALAIGGKNTVFNDVPDSHWAAPYVSLACDFDIMIGIGEDRFEPDSYVTYEEAVKSIVCALGYGQIIEQSNEIWYMPYMTEAAKLRLLDNVDETFEFGKPLKRGQVALLLDNSLDTETMVRDNDRYIITNGGTFLERLFEGGKYTGIVEATSEASFFGDEELREDEVIISGLRYKTGLTNVSEYLGYSVDFYGNNVDGNAVLGSVILSNKNKMLTVLGKDCDSSSRTGLSYYIDEKDNVKTIKFSDNLRVILNGKVYNGYDEKIFSWPNVKSLFIDNDNDGKYDVAKLTASEVHQVEHVNLYNKKIYLKSNLESGTNVIDLLDENELKYSIKSYDGKDLSLSDISEEDIFLEIFASYDMKKLEIISLNDNNSGELSQIDFGEELITIDDTTYPVFSTKSGSSIDFSKLKIGSYCTYIVNTEGELVYIEPDTMQGNMKYGYIYDINVTKTLNSEVKLKMLKGTLTEQIKEKDKYYLIGKESQEINKFTLADKVEIDDTMCKTVDAQIMKLKIGDVVRYSLNAEGKINKISISKEMGSFGERNFNAEVQVFGGITHGAFGIDGKTVAFFLPAGTNEDDIQSVMKYTSDEYECQGFDETEEGNVAGAMVFQTDIDSDKEVYFNDDVPFAVVQASTINLDENGGEYIHISGFEEGKEFSYQTGPDAPAYEMLKDAKCGDIYRFSKNFRGEIVTAQKILTGYDAKNPEHLTPDYPFYERSGTGNKQVFGMVTEAEYKILSEYSTEYENILYISTSENGSNSAKYSLIFKESEAPYYYIYDYRKGTVIPARFKDIVSSGNSNLEGASRVFVYSLNNVVKLVMIVI